MDKFIYLINQKNQIVHKESKRIDMESWLMNHGYTFKGVVDMRTQFTHELGGVYEIVRCTKKDAVIRYGRGA